MNLQQPFGLTMKDCWLEGFKASVLGVHRLEAGEHGFWLEDSQPATKFGRVLWRYGSAQPINGSVCLMRIVVSVSQDGNNVMIREVS